MMQLTPAEIELLPTDEDVAKYHELGYYISPVIFSDAEIEAASEGSNRFYAGARDFPPPNGNPIRWGWKPEDGNVLRKNDHSTLQNRELAALVRKPILGAI